MSKNKTTTIIISLCIALGSFFFSFNVNAQNGAFIGDKLQGIERYQGAKVPQGDTFMVPAEGCSNSCFRIQNTSGKDLFIPTNSCLEWDQFLANLPEGVTILGCYTYSWKTGSYGSCSNSCGSGTQSRSGWCERSDGTTVADSSCAGTKPTTSQSCTDDNGCTYSWKTGSYGSCSASPYWGSYGSCSASPYWGSYGACNTTCGSGTQYRTCYGTSGTQYRTCYGTSGTQSRSVWCERSDGTTVADSSCAETKPTTSQSCTASCSGSSSRSCTASCSGSSSQSCTNYSGCTYSWVTGSWGGCSLSCGGGTQTRTVTCQRSDGTTVADSSCAGTKPATSQSCNTHACPLSNGSACSLNSQCASGYCYRDQDGDRYAATSGTKYCQASSSLGTDCYDLNANARPGQTNYFTSQRGDGSFDYNCDGSTSYHGGCIMINKATCSIDTTYTGTCSTSGKLCRTGSSTPYGPLCQNQCGNFIMECSEGCRFYAWLDPNDCSNRGYEQPMPTWGRRCLTAGAPGAGGAGGFSSAQVYKLNGVSECPLSTTSCR